MSSPSKESFSSQYYTAPENGKETEKAQIREPSQPFHDARSQPNCSTTQIEPRVEEFIRARARANEQETRAAAHDIPSESKGSTTQVEPRVADFTRQLANEDHDAPVEDITAILTKARPAAPDARLLIHSNYPEGHNMRRHQAVTRLRGVVRGKEIFAVAQRLHDVYFTVQFSAPIELICQVVYDPGSENCLVVNLSPKTTQIQLSGMGPSSTLFVIERKQGQLVQPGIWKIAANRGSDHYPLFAFLLLGRPFDVSIHEANVPVVKRAVDDSEKSTKRQKLDNEIPAEIIATQSTDSLTIKSGPADTNIGAPREIVNKAAVPLLELGDREIAVIKSPNTPGSETYQLQRIKQLGNTRSTSVFSCRHSGIPRRRLVVKVLRYNGSSALTLPGYAKLWETEKLLLEKVKHRNVVALEAFDGRMFALYLELLPLSLHRGLHSPFRQPDAYQILLDMSSALAYLASQEIVHNDIKPGNIAYSPQRGAVLLDFGMACNINKTAGGGTPWYIPPDLIDNESRGLPGDIWAMGVTMLYVLQKMVIPERMTRGWNLQDLVPPAHKESSAYCQMEGWLDIVAEKRAELNQKDLVENAVFHMLDREVTLRVAAGGIKEALKVPLEAC